MSFRVGLGAVFVLVAVGLALPLATASTTVPPGDSADPGHAPQRVADEVVESVPPAPDAQTLAAGLVGTAVSNAESLRDGSGTGGGSGGAAGSSGGASGDAGSGPLLSAEPVTKLAAQVAADPVTFLATQIHPYEERARELGDGLQGALLPAEGAGNDGGGSPQMQGISQDGPALSAMAVAGVVVAGAVATGGLLFWLGASGTVGSTAAGSAPATQQLRRLLPYASPLFTRFEKDTVLGHPKRESLYALILQTPGISLQALCDGTGLSRTAVAHHLRLLELQHLIVSKRHGRSRHYFENGGRYGREQKDAYAVLQNSRSRDVASFIRDHPGAIQKAICSSMAIQASIAHWHVRRLEEAGLVQAVRRGRTVAYFPTPTLEQAARNAVPGAAASAPVSAQVTA